MWRVFCLMVFLSLPGCSITHALRVQDGQRVSLEQMLVELGATPLVFVGESHDSSEHHDLQLRVIEGLHATGTPLAIGLEMFQLDSQQVLDDWVTGQLPEAQLVRAYQANWRNLNWTLYRAIFVYARDQHLPMVALNVPQAIIQKVGRGGFTALSDADLQALPPGATHALSDTELDCMAQVYTGHATQRQAMFNLCEAQALRNRVMARAIERYQAHAPDARMVVLAGALHAHRWLGVPARLQDQRYKVLLPPMPDVDLHQPQAIGADYLLN